MDKNKLDSILDEVKTLRDTINVYANLAKAEAEDDYNELESKYEKFVAKSKKISAAAGDTLEELRVAAELGIDADSEEDLDTALELAGEEIKKGYEKIKKMI